MHKVPGWRIYKWVQGAAKTTRRQVDVSCLYHEALRGYGHLLGGWCGDKVCSVRHVTKSMFRIFAMKDMVISPMAGAATRCAACGV